MFGWDSSASAVFPEGPVNFQVSWWVCRRVLSNSVCVLHLFLFLSVVHFTFSQEVLDSLVNSETLPTKLAEVINQFVAEWWVWLNGGCGQIVGVVC